MKGLSHRSFILACSGIFGLALCALAEISLAQSLARLAAPKDVAVANLPPGFAERVVATGLTGGTGMAVAPDGRVFVCEQTGSLRVVENDVLLAKPFVTLEVDAAWERGLIGVALDPEFEANGYVYLCYVSPQPFPHHVVSRFTARGNVAAAGSEKVLVEGDDQRTLGGSIPAGHQGGGIRFGKDGKLYVAIGEQTAGQPAQRLDTFQGKLLRMNADGSIPEDNPFFNQAQGKYRAIWAFGLRNPFATVVQPSTGRIYINDVGSSRWEEVNEGRAGANFGWPVTEGPTTNAAHQSPLYAYGEGPQSITGGAFYEPLVAQFPEEYVGKYFFADYLQNWIRVLDPEQPSEVRPFANMLAGPVAIEVAPDGSLYYLNRNVWVRDEEFQEGTGTLHKIVYLPKDNASGPRITQQPKSITRTPGETATFRIEAVAEAPLRYQWRRDGKDQAGANSPELTLTAADHGAEFVCLVSSGLWTVSSDPARLWVVPRLKPPEPAAPVTSGVNYSLYETDETGLPEFERLKPLRSDSAYGIGIPPRPPEDGFALAFDGLINVPDAGAYTFYLQASGACRLFIAGRDVAFVSPFANSRESSGAVGLEPGRHAFRLLYAHREGKPRLRLEVADPKHARRTLPSAWLERINPRVLNPPDIAPNESRHSGPIWIQLAATTDDTIIQYTLDGRDPDGESPRYREPFLLSKSATVKARAFRLGGDGVTHASAVSEKSFVIEGDRPFGLGPRPVATSLNVDDQAADLPPKLSQTRLFRSLADLSPQPGLIPYTVNAPLWSDGAEKRRWIALPGNAAIAFRETRSWTFPAGTIFVKHFEFPQAGEPPRRLETRVLYVDRDGLGYGATYQWNAEQTDADLLVDAKTETIEVAAEDGPRSISWYYPSRKDCLVCHTANAGFVLGVNTRQLNCEFAYPETKAVDNQLRTWASAGMFENPPDEARLSRLPRLAAVSDSAAPLEHRVRSYLDSNCAQCHRPGGARGTFDARFDVPLSRQGLIGGKLIAADIGVENAEVVAPGSLDRSMLYLRMKRRQDVYNMPPLATHEVDRDALAVIAEWIESLPLPDRK